MFYFDFQSFALTFNVLLWLSMFCFDLRYFALTFNVLLWFSMFFFNFNVILWLSMFCFDFQCFVLTFNVLFWLSMFCFDFQSFIFFRLNVLLWLSMFYCDCQCHALCGESFRKVTATTMSSREADMLSRFFLRNFLHFCKIRFVQQIFNGNKLWKIFFEGGAHTLGCDGHQKPN